jgi:hypothetical protein
MDLMELQRSSRKHPRGAASFCMRSNCAAHADARAGAVLCKGHRARAGGCRR